jgi:hypothetical protein
MTKMTSKLTAANQQRYSMETPEARGAREGHRPSHSDYVTRLFGLRKALGGGDR